MYTDNHRNVFERGIEPVDQPLGQILGRRHLLQLFAASSGLMLSGCGGGGSGGGGGLVGAAAPAPSPSPTPAPTPTPTPPPTGDDIVEEVAGPKAAALRTRPTLPTLNVITVDLSDFDPLRPFPGWDGKKASQSSSGKFPADRDLLILGHKRAVWQGEGYIRGGRNVHWVGGTYATGVWARNFVGDACVEGVLVRMPFVETGSETGDGISLTPDSTTQGRSKIYILNCRVENIDGFVDGHHGDCFQLASQYDWPNGFSGVPAEVTIERFTGTTGCQGLFLANQHFDSHGYTYNCQKLSLIDVNLRKTRKHLLYKNGTAKGTFVLLYLVDLNPSARGDRPYQKNFENVYLEPWAGETLNDCVYPSTKEYSFSKYLQSSLAPVLGLLDTALAYPSAMLLSGDIKRGAPPKGDFASAAPANGRGRLNVPGIGYVSPGYAA